MRSVFVERRRSRRRAGDPGVALLVVLWVLSLLSVIAAGLTGQVRTDLLITRNLIENARARALAEAGVFFAIPHLLDSDPETRWRTDGQTHQFAYGGGRIDVSLQDEGGKIDINAAPDELLAGLFRVVGLGAEETARLVDAIADWKDADDLRRVNGAEAEDYRRAGLLYVPRNGPFEAVEELRLVLGMTRPLYQRILPFVTVHSANARINSLTASAEVLRALPGIGADSVELYLAARERARAPVTGTRGSARAAAAGLPVLPGVEQYLVRGEAGVTTIRAQGTTPGGGLFVREAIVDTSGKSGRLYRLVAWRRAPSAEPPTRE